MLKKFFMVVVAVFLLLSPIVGSTMEVTMPYFKMITDKKKDIRNISIQLPPEVTVDFTTWPIEMGSYQGEREYREDALGIDALICELAFTSEETKTIYVLYVYCKAPLVLGLEKTQGTTSSYWKYVDKKPIKVTEKSFSVFLISATYAKEM